jgi:hypothetical protein
VKAANFAIAMLASLFGGWLDKGLGTLNMPATFTSNTRKKSRSRTPWSHFHVWYVNHVRYVASKDSLPRGYPGAKIARRMKQGTLTKCHP